MVIYMMERFKVSLQKLLAIPVISKFVISDFHLSVGLTPTSGNAKGLSGVLKWDINPEMWCNNVLKVVWLLSYIRPEDRSLLKEGMQ